MNRADVAVVGGGIVGLAMAWESARRGQSVVLFERSRLAHGASIRNFGMVWPIGQPPGERYQLALRSQQRWLELGQKAGISVQRCGSVHLAHADDEAAVLQEFAAQAPGLGIDCRWVEAKELLTKQPALVLENLRGGLHSDAELVVDPREVIARLPHYLAESYGVTLRYETAIVGVDLPAVRSASGETWHVDRCFVCAGADFESLFPRVYASAGVRRCKLQMMRTAPQPDGWRLGTHLAGGLTLAHYQAFEVCPTLPRLKARLRAEYGDYLDLGIHVMASQNARGEVVIGDSHEYDDYTIFDRSDIDERILRYLQTMIRLPDERIAERWHGVYAKHPSLPWVEAEPQPGCQVIVSPGGAGMTLSFGIAAQWWDRHTGTTS